MYRHGRYREAQACCNACYPRCFISWGYIETIFLCSIHEIMVHTRPNIVYVNPSDRHCFVDIYQDLECVLEVSVTALDMVSGEITALSPPSLEL